MLGGGDDPPVNVRYMMMCSKRFFCVCAYFIYKNEVRATGKAI